MTQQVQKTNHDGDVLEGWHDYSGEVFHPNYGVLYEFRNKPVKPLKDGIYLRESSADSPIGPVLYRRTYPDGDTDWYVLEDNTNEFSFMTDAEVREAGYFRVVKADD